MLVTGHRIQTLSVIRVDYIHVQEKEIIINIPDRIKTSKPDRKQPRLVLPFYTKKEICVAQTLMDYISITKDKKDYR